MRNNGGPPARICTSLALDATALRRMSWIKCNAFLYRVFRPPEAFVGGRQTFHDFLEPVFAQRDQAAFAAKFSELRHVGIARHLIAQPIVHDQKFVDAQSAEVSRFAALVAHLAAPHYVSGE